jgi:hypothetical protein
MGRLPIQRFFETFGLAFPASGLAGIAENPIES